MTRWRRLARRSLTTLHPPKRPTTSDRCLRSTTQAGLIGSPITGCHAGSTPPTHRPGPYRSTNPRKINEQISEDVLGFLAHCTCGILRFAFFNFKFNSFRISWCSGSSLALTKLVKELVEVHLRQTLSSKKNT